MGISFAAQSPCVLAGIAVGVVSFLPITLALLPVIRGRGRVSMVLGVLALGLSAVILVAGVAYVRFSIQGDPVAFSIGELVGFFAELAYVAWAVVKAK